MGSHRNRKQYMWDKREDMYRKKGELKANVKYWHNGEAGSKEEELRPRSAPAGLSFPT